MTEQELARIGARALAIDAARASSDEIAWVDDVIRLVAEIRRLQATLRRINTATVTDEGPLATLWTVQRLIDAALAASAPGATRRTETPEELA